jgi:hypothetical protein
MFRFEGGILASNHDGEVLKPARPISSTVQGGGKQWFFYDSPPVLLAIRARFSRYSA